MKAYNQTKIIKTNILNLLELGIDDKSLIYDQVSERMKGIPRPTIRRAAMDLRWELEEKLRILINNKIPEPSKYLKKKRELLLLEALAELEHKQWVSWAKSLIENENLSDIRVLRWKELINTPYELLTEQQKSQDREFALLVIELLKEKRLL